MGDDANGKIGPPSERFLSVLRGREESGAGPLVELRYRRTRSISRVVPISPQRSRENIGHVVELYFALG